MITNEIRLPEDIGTMYCACGREMKGPERVSKIKSAETWRYKCSKCLLEIQLRIPHRAISETGAVLAVNAAAISALKYIEEWEKARSRGSAINPLFRLGNLVLMAEDSMARGGRIPDDIVASALRIIAAILNAQARRER